MCRSCRRGFKGSDGLNVECATNNGAIWEVSRQQLRFLTARVWATRAHVAAALAGKHFHGTGAAPFRAKLQASSSLLRRPLRLKRRKRRNANATVDGGTFPVTRHFTAFIPTVVPRADIWSAGVRLRH